MVNRDPTLDSQPFQFTPLDVIHLDPRGYHTDTITNFGVHLYKIHHPRGARYPKESMQIARCYRDQGPSYSLEWTCDSFANFCAEEGVYTQSQAHTISQFICDDITRGAEVLSRKILDGKGSLHHRRVNDLSDDDDYDNVGNN